MYLLVSLRFLLAFCLTAFPLLLRLWPRPRNFAIRFCVDAVTFFETISLGFWSGDDRAMSVNISPPVRNVSRPRALAPLQKIGLATLQIPLKNCRIRSPVEGRAESNIRVRYRYSYRARLMKGVPHEGLHEFKMCDGDYDEGFLYHAETRRKCRTTFRGGFATLEFTSAARYFQDLYSYIFNCLFFVRQIINIIVCVHHGV